MNEQKPPKDWELLGWIVLVLVVVAVPLLLAWWHTPPGKAFTGFLSDRDQDAWSYIAKMRQGYDGGWRYENLYTETPHDGVHGVFLYYRLLGHFARATGLSLIATYHLARLACTALFLFGLDRFLALIWPERRQRRWAFALVVFGGGLGWLNEVNAYWGDARWWPGWLFPADLVWAGLTTFGSIMLYSHYPLALWLILECYRQAYLAEIKGRLPWKAALAATALAIHHAYDIVPVLVVLAAWHLWRARWHGRLPVLRMTLIGTAASIPVGYYFWVFTYHPMFSRWAKQNVCLSPHPAVYLLAFGIAGAFALFGLRKRPEPRDLWVLLGAWLVLNDVLLYAPLSWQRLMMLGLPMVWMIWGARGLFALGERFPYQRRALLFLGIALALPGTWQLYNVGLTSRSYLDADELAAYRWLEAQPKGGAVLASVVTGNRLVGMSGQRVFLGHWSETPGYHKALHETKLWYEGKLGSAWLRAHRIRYVVWGPREQALCATPPLSGAPAYTNNQYSVWHIDGSAKLSAVEANKALRAFSGVLSG